MHTYYGQNGMKCRENIAPIPNDVKIKGVRKPQTGQRALSRSTPQSVPIIVRAGIILGQYTSHGRSILAM